MGEGVCMVPSKAEMQICLHICNKIPEHCYKVNLKSWQEGEKYLQKNIKITFSLAKIIVRIQI